MPSTTGLHRRGARPPAPPSPSPPTSSPSAQTTRDWAALPLDVLLDVFLRLGSRGVMRGAELACTPWRDVAVGEPALWHRVDMATVRLWSPGWRAMVRAAVDRGAGQCVAFAGPADDVSLLYLVDSCPLLESLHITGSLIGSEMDEEVRGKCARVRNLTLPDYDPPGEAYDHDDYSDWYWYGM
ncbi:putative F-box/LRR-repeat protein 23 [Panicum hallii]|uniref:putative F-box/LRR-repeat protein 23 n=1 Tax=Panicum hallii TaxID=206008 RepID=UPI000DF4DA41|nr:putative F-box/LRR-repeat protein 23 [Panicum hallii]